MLVSDNAGNTRVARELIHNLHPTILTTQDPPHHLSNLIKDICRLEYFKLVCPAPASTPNASPLARRLNA